MLTVNCQLLSYGGYSSTVRTSVCGTDDEGSIPSSHPIIQRPSRKRRFLNYGVVSEESNNDDYTFTQESRFGLDKVNGDISMEGVWKMDGYQEPTSGSEFTGAIAVNFSGNVHDQKDAEDEIEISFDLSIYGDKVDTIAFTMAPDDHRIESPPDLRVNGKPYAFDNDLSFIASVTNTFRSLGL